MSQAPILRMRGVTKRFGSNEALRGVDLDVHRGEIVGFVGPNGAGKSTCLRISVGIVQRDAGEVSVHGLDPARAAVAIRKQTQYLTGETSSEQMMTGHAFMDYARHGYAIDDSVLDLAPELFDLPLRQRIRSYSAGMKQRLALRAALTTAVDLLILDEPDRAIDASARLQLRAVLRAIAKDRGRSILLSSHHLSELEAIADRNVFLLDGNDVPDALIDRARSRLKNHVRLRLSRSIELPDGVEDRNDLADGGLALRLRADPVRWLATLPADAIQSAEIGATRLEDLYREITDAARAVTTQGVGS